MILVEIPYIDPLEAAARLAARPRFSFLDSAMLHRTLGRWSFLATDPVGLFRVERGEPSWNGRRLAGGAMPALRAKLAEFSRGRIEGGPPFQGGAIGFFAYEAGRMFETVPATAPHGDPVPQVDLAFYDTLLALDAIERRAFLVGPDEAALAALGTRLEGDAPQPSLPVPAVTWRDSRSRTDYEAEIARVIRYIRDGDIFQANISHRFSAIPDVPPDAFATYRALRAANPAPFAALLVDGGRFIASTSPERFLSVADGRVEARPIKGTRRRETDPRRDREIARELARSAKDRAENVMIVDLLRNDLSRVCEPGTVDVPALCAVETYAGVHHLTSSVVGRLAAGRDAIDLIAATFPGGSITGAPKIRAMEIIAELEREDRGIYCGSIGWIGFDGSMDLNIAIRTLTFDGRELAVSAGGGITLLSNPSAEFDETVAKAERLLGALSIGESAAEADAAA
jgi:para-aminobenzoate synthetase component 1